MSAAAPVVDRAAGLSAMAERFADVPRRVIRRLAGGRPWVPVDDLAQDTWVRIAAEVRAVPADASHQRALVGQYAEWTFLGWYQRKGSASGIAERAVDTISELAERRRRGEVARDPDDVVIGLAWRQTVEQTVLAREQLRVVRAAIAQMTPTERLGLASAMALGYGSPRHAGAAKERLAAALAHAGYPFRYGTRPPYPRHNATRMAEYNSRPEVQERERVQRVRRRAGAGRVG